jgi:Holliday junction resolvase RusA-like endonuclease
MRCTFDVPGPPVPKARARVTARGTFTPKRVLEYEGRVRAAAMLALATLGCAWPRDREYRVQVAVWRARHSGDCDNYSKAVLDALNAQRAQTRKGKVVRVAEDGLFWRDDVQVCELHVKRFDDRNDPRTMVTVEVT